MIYKVICLLILAIARSTAQEASPCDNPPEVSQSPLAHLESTQLALIGEAGSEVTIAAPVRPSPIQHNFPQLIRRAPLAGNLSSTASAGPQRTHSPPADQASSSSTSKSLSSGAIAGAAVGGVAGVVLIVGAIVGALKYRKDKERKKDPSQNMPEISTMEPDYGEMYRNERIQPSSNF